MCAGNHGGIIVLLPQDRQTAAAQVTVSARPARATQTRLHAAAM